MSEPGHLHPDEEQGEFGAELAILVVGDETVASTRHRILVHVPALAAAGFQVSVAQQRPRPKHRLLRVPLRLLDEIRDFRRAARADVLMIHRRCYPPVIANRLFRQRRPVVVDVDDALYLPSPTEPQTAAVRKRHRKNFDATAALADLVLCGNDELASEVPHDRTTVLPTAVDCTRFRPRASPGDGLTVGWVGHSSNLGYLEALADPLREIASRHPGFRLRVVADRSPRLDGVPLEFRRWTLDQEVACFDGLDIGLMPLLDTPWTRAKCAFKLLQYMALEIPAIASPVGMNRQVVRHEVNGLFASSDREWVVGLERLVTDVELRRRLGRDGRTTVLERYDLPVVSHRLIESLRTVVARGATSVELA
jgi:glycosyltransferase involved in cell wall biosynthesis